MRAHRLLATAAVWCAICACSAASADKALLGSLLVHPLKLHAHLLDLKDTLGQIGGSSSTPVTAEALLRKATAQAWGAAQAAAQPLLELQASAPHAPPSVGAARAAPAFDFAALLQRLPATGSRRLHEVASPLAGPPQAAQAQVAARGQTLQAQAEQLARMVEASTADVRALFSGAALGAAADPKVAAYARGLAARYTDLHRQGWQQLANSTVQAVQQARQRRLLQTARGASDADASPGDSYDYADGAAPPLLVAGPTEVHHTMVFVLPPGGGGEQSAALLGELMAFVRNAIEVSAAAGLQAERRFGAAGRRSAWPDGGRWVEGALWPEEDAVLPAEADAEYSEVLDDGRDFAFAEQHDVAGAPPSRRRLNSQAKPARREPPTAPSSGDYYEDAAYDDLDDAYEEDAAWLWAVEAQGPEGAVALVGGGGGGAEGDEEMEEELMTLMVEWLAPEPGGGVPAELLEVLADPQGSSAAELLTLLGDLPSGGELHVERAAPSSRGQDTPPRFAVFGPSALADAAQASGAPGGAAARRPARARAADAVLAPLGAAARAPARHQEGAAALGGVDARWWGVALGLGALGMLLVGTSLAALKRGSGGGQGLPGEEDALLRQARQAYTGGGGGGGREVPATPVSAWENKGQHKVDPKGRVAKEGAARKTSNLPA